MSQYIIIKGDKSYLKFNHDGKHSFTTNFQLAQRFDDKKAEAYILNNMTKKDRYKYKVISDKATDIISTATSSEIHSILDVFTEHTWINICTQFEDVMSNISKHKDTLAEQMRIAEGENCDIDHRFEFPKKNGKEYNAVELLKFAKIKRDTERKIRKIKDELSVIGILEDSSLNDFIMGRVGNRINGLFNREYCPRILHELFE